MLQLVLFSFCPESPRYLLITANREEEARTGKWRRRRWNESLKRYSWWITVELFYNPSLSVAMKRLRASSHIEEDMEEMRLEGEF